MSPAPATILARFGAILGVDHVFTDESRLAPYEIDGLRPSAAVRPADAEQVAEVVRFAAAEKLAVVPCGARTKLGIGMPPVRYDVALDLTRLDRVVAYDPGDLTLSVEAGLGLAKLAAVLAEHKQFVPLAVPFTSQTTVGGTIATGVDSPLRQFYGTARDYVLGVEFVTGDGLTAKSGGRVVKNVAGYDLHKLMIGSLGTLGVLTRVNFRTFPLAPASRGFLAFFPTLEGALVLRKQIVQSPLQPLTLEILSPEVAQTFARRAPRTLGMDLGPPGPWFTTSECTLAVGFGGNPQVIERHTKELSRMAEEAHATSAVVLGDAERPLIWGRLRECLPMLLEESPAATILKISTLPAQHGTLLQEVRRATEAQGLRGATLTRGTGVTYAALLPEEKTPDTLERLASACAAILEASVRLGGSATIPWCPLELKRRVNVWGPPRGDVELMRKMKQAFDPQGILGPGRFVGGI